MNDAGHGAGPGLGQGSAPDGLLRLRPSHGHVCPGIPWRGLGGKGSQVVGHSGSPTAASILSVIHDIGVLSKAVSEKQNGFPPARGAGKARLA